MTVTLRKTDILIGIILGLIIAIFIIAILKNLRDSVPIPSFLTDSEWLLLFLFPLIVTSWTFITFYLGTKWPVFFQFGKLITIGFSNTAIDFGVLNLLMYFSGVEKGILFSIFKGISFLVAVTNSYVWNKYWTFDNPEGKKWAKQFIMFFVISGTAFLINVSVASFIVNVLEPFGNITPTIWANFGAFASLIITLFWTFLGYKFIVFKK